MIHVGIDWGRHGHYFVAVSEDGHVLDNGRVEHSFPALEQMRARLSKLEPDARQVRVAFEMHSGGLLQWLRNQDYSLYTIASNSSDSARELFSPSGGKDDPRDASTLAELLRMDAKCMRRHDPLPELSEVLLQWLRMREDLVQARVAIQHQMRAILAEFSPELSKACNNFRCNWQRTLLASYPSQHALRQARWEEIAAICSRCRSAALERVRAAFETEAMPLSAQKLEVIEQELLLLLEDLERLTERINEIENKLEELIADHPRKHLAESLPVRGIVTRATLLAIMARADTLHWEDLVTEWGVVPVTKQSGSHREVRRRKACNHHICRFLTQFAFNTLQFEGSWAREYYDNKKAEDEKKNKGNKGDKRHFTRLRCLAKGWVKILWAMWRDNAEYDEQYHQANRRTAA